MHAGKYTAGGVIRTSSVWHMCIVYYVSHNIPFPTYYNMSEKVRSRYTTHFSVNMSYNGFLRHIIICRKKVRSRCTTNLLLKVFI